MEHRSTQWTVLWFFFLSLCSCSTTSFVYDHPQASTSSSTNLKIAILTQKDERHPNEETDKIWSNNPLDETAKIIEQEIKSCGLFQEVVLASKPDEEKAIMERSDMRMLLRPTLRDLSWDIPNRQAQEKTALVVSILTGGIGGLIYGSGSTDLYGNAKLGVTLEDRETSKIILEKEYASRAEDTMARLKTDSYEERARIIGKAFKQIMEQFKADLHTVVRTVLETKR